MDEEPRALGSHEPHGEATVTLFAVMGHPIAHSLSPRLHMAGFRACHWAQCFYIPLDVRPEALTTALDAFAQLGGFGVNLTRPLKEQAFQAAWLARVDDWGRHTGAVNTLTKTQSGWAGANTDAPALVEALMQRGMTPRKALIFGSGGAARASMAAFHHLGVDTVVASRRAALSWAENVVTWDQALEEATGYDVVINATPLGQEREAGWPRLPRWNDHPVVIDWVYAPRLTPFLISASKAGALTIDGLELLVRQAGLAWREWFDRPGPLTAMAKALGIRL